MNTWDSLVSKGLARTDVPLRTLTTYKLGGPASILIEAEHLEHLAEVATAFREEPRPILVVGRGSNLVIADKGFPGVAIHLGKQFGEIEVADRVTAGGAAGLPQVARSATKGGRLGLEFMIGVPGSVGGAVRQNAGCFGQEIASVLVDARLFDLEVGKLIEVSNEDLDFSYRHSALLATQIVVDARFATHRGQPGVGDEKIREITRWRRLNQPGGTLNAGSVFKNPPGDTAGRIIDSVGLKSLTVGGASVSDKHANFFVAMPGTRARDVYLLVQEVACRVKDATGIVLEPEIQFVGDFEGDTLG